MRAIVLLTLIALLGCSQQTPEKADQTDSSSLSEKYPLSLPPAIMDAEVDSFAEGEMDVLFGELNANTYVMVSFDDTSLTEEISAAIEAKNRMALSAYADAGWVLSVPAGTRLVALHADEYPYVRIQLEDVAFGKRRGHVHEKYLKLDDGVWNLTHYTSDRGRGKDWRSR